MSDKRVIGTCGNCGGPVEAYIFLHYVGPMPPPKCHQCGAEPANAHGPVIPMKRTPSPDDPSPYDLSRARGWMK